MKKPLGANLNFYYYFTGKIGSQVFDAKLKKNLSIKIWDGVMIQLQDTIIN